MSPRSGKPLTTGSIGADSIAASPLTSPRWVAAATLVVLVIAIVVVAALRTPWHMPQAPRADQLAALDSLPSDAVDQGRAYHSALRPGSYGSLAVGLVVALLLGLTPLGSRLVEAVGRPFGGHWLAQALLGGVAIALIGQLVTVPLAARQHSISHRYGLSTQGWGGWAIDVAKSYAIGAVLVMVALAAFFTITRLAPRWWWTWAAGGAAALVVTMAFVFPVLVEPAFNKFTPMAAGQLRDDLIAMAARDGEPVHDVLVADASRRTKGVNAYVSGLGPTRRIVVYDTLLDGAPPAEVKAVVAHELGHASDHDGPTGAVLAALGAAAAVAALYLVGSWGGLLRLAGVGSIAEPRAVALLVALATVAGLVAGPVQAFISRRIEGRADAHALALTHDPQTYETMQARLVSTNLGDPDPPRWEYLLFATHPSAVERIAAARAWARTAGTKTTGTKSTGTKSTGTKTSGTKSTGTKTSGDKSTGAGR